MPRIISFFDERTNHVCWIKRVFFKTIAIGTDIFYWQIHEKIYVAIIIEEFAIIFIKYIILDFSFRKVIFMNAAIMLWRSERPVSTTLEFWKFTLLVNTRSTNERFSEFLKLVGSLTLFRMDLIRAVQGWGPT